ncbi:hypothetical protein BC629DRAFT_1290483 [Irpex lacteus]|nr:hypothetical protein BC629DRAFT_1290483 [Irpex lacteus]
MSDNTDVTIIDDLHDLPSPHPTLPPPMPGSSTPSFFLPQKQEGLFASLARKTVRRRKKKLIVCGMDSHFNEEALLAWCELHGAVRRFERRENGDIHVYWKEWEVADTVCRVNAQVYIKNVGRVGLTWRYVN